MNFFSLIKLLVSRSRWWPTGRVRVTTLSVNGLAFKRKGSLKPETGFRGTLLLYSVGPLPTGRVVEPSTTSLKLWPPPTGHVVAQLTTPLKLLRCLWFHWFGPESVVVLRPVTANAVFAPPEWEQTPLSCVPVTEQEGQLLTGFWPGR